MTLRLRPCRVQVKARYVKANDEPFIRKILKSVLGNVVCDPFQVEYVSIRSCPETTIGQHAISTIGSFAVAAHKAYENRYQ